MKPFSLLGFQRILSSPNPFTEAPYKVSMKPDSASNS